MRSLVLLLIPGIAVAVYPYSKPQAAAENTPVRKATGIEKRELWTTSKVKGSPEPPDPYRVERVYPKLKFDEALEIAAVPGRNAWGIAERKGKIYVFDATAKEPEKKLVLDVKHTVYGFAFHPKFAETGFIFLSEVPDGSKETPDGSRVMRYTVDPKTGTADEKSAKQIITWPSGGHNGGCLRFGPDGMLYLSTGDSSGIADTLEYAQNLGVISGKILRIDVTETDRKKSYSIPGDNPFVKTEGARGEIYAYGIRQSWKFSFDTANGDLWAGEVGQDLWDMVLKIDKGGNYGWSIKEGTHDFRPERKRGPTAILPPVVEHNHAEFRSVTGGFVYRGKKVPELKGLYIYGDYDTGRIWTFKYDPKTKKPVEGWHFQLVDTTLRIVAWGQDADGEVVALDFIDGGIYRIVVAPKSKDVAPPAKFPIMLSETGVFSSTKDHVPAKGLIPYSVNAELWSDGAFKERFIGLPGDSKIEYETVIYPQPAPGSVPGWRFPDGTVLVKTFSLETEPGKKRRLETRLLVAERVGGTEEYGDQVWSGYTYIWNDEQTDAELADAKGVDREFNVGEKKQKWHFPSRTECTMCHTVTAKYALGVNTAQMNKDHDYGGTIANQLSTLEHLGIFDKKLPKPVDRLDKLVDPRDEKADLDKRARSYLQANCSHCHRKWGGGNAEFQLLYTLPIKETDTIGVKPGQGSFDLKDPKLLVPGDPSRSMIHHRMTRLGLGRMPHIASNVVDEKAVALIEKWIAGMKE